MSINRLEEQHIYRNLHPKTKRGALALMDNVAFQDGRAFNMETGEEVTHLVQVGLKTTDKQIRGIKAVDELKSHQKELGGFIFVFFKQLNKMEHRFPKLTKQDVARLMYIATFVAWGTNRLQSDNGKKHYAKIDLEELVGLSRKRFNEFYKKLIDDNIIEETETGELFMNQSVFYSGFIKQNEYDVRDLDYTLLFKNTVRKLYDEYRGRRLAQLANIYSVMPFINLNYNIVCHNPAETSEELIKPMSLNELATLLDYSDAHKLKRALESIRVNNRPVFWIPPNVNDKRELRIIVSPYVIFAGSGESLKAVKAQFN